MKLNHYTKDLIAAKSIITSEQLWMGKTGKAPKDKDEILHYFNLFNDLHNITELEMIINDPSSISHVNTQDSLYARYLLAAAQSYYMKAHQLRIGDTLASVIRDESYIVCFTEESERNTDFHSDVYGPICFHFSENPIVQNKKQFVWMEAPILYIETTRYSHISKVVDEIYDVLLSSELEFVKSQPLLDSMLMELRKSLKDNADKKVDQTRMKSMLKSVSTLLAEQAEERKAFIQHAASHGSIVSELEKLRVAEYLQHSVTNQRERAVLRRNSPETQRVLRKNGNFRLDYESGHLQNIVSCFIKDAAFQNDNEVRIIALPVESYMNPDDTILKASYDTKKLDCISISSNYPDREQAAAELKDLLESLHLDHVQVI